MDNTVVVGFDDTGHSARMIGHVVLAEHHPTITEPSGTLRVPPTAERPIAVPGLR